MGTLDERLGAESEYAIEVDDVPPNLVANALDALEHVQAGLPDRRRPVSVLFDSGASGSVAAEDPEGRSKLIMPGHAQQSAELLFRDLCAYLPATPWTIRLLGVAPATSSRSVQRV